MNAFAENPLFLFMDDLSPPIIAVKNPRESRKIVELSDTGCDARTTVPSAGRKSISRRPTRSPNVPSNDKWKLRGENEPYERVERNVIESDERYFVSRNGGFVQPGWQKYSAYEDFDETGHRRRSDNPRPGIRVSPEAHGNGNRRRRDDDGIEDPYRIEPSTVRRVGREPPLKCPNDPYLSQRRPGNNNLGPRNGSKYKNSVYPTLDTDDPRLIRNNEIHPYFEDNHPFRNRNEHWQRCNFLNSDHEDFYEEMSFQRNQTYARYGPKDERPASSSNEVSKDWDDRNYGTRTRSRTCSPPRDRRKRTQTYPKGRTFYDEEHLASTQQIFSNDLAFPTGKAAINEVPKRYVDRAVDKDSLSELHHAGTSTEPRSVVEEKESGYISKCAVRTNFWDFIPLDDGDDKKSKSPSVDKNTAPAGRRQPASPSKDTDSRSKRRAGESIDANPSRPEFARSAEKSQASRKNALNQRENVRRPGSNLKTEENKDTVDAHGSKSRVKVASRLSFGWLGKNRADLKRPGRNGSPAKSESSDEQNKKKRMDGGYVTNICEKTVASLKRKLDKSDGEKASAATAAYSIKEKKTRSEESSCSRLPLRVGNRLRSRNPILNRINQKDNVPQEAKREDHPTGLGSTRSRTKPKTKSNLLASEVADLVETSEHGRSIGEGGGEREGGFAEEKSRSIENDVDAKERPLEETSQAEPMDSKNVPEAGTRLENDFMDEIDQPRSGLKDKCCFQLDDVDSMVCSSSCQKDNGNFGPTEFHPKKPIAAIRTQF